MPRERELQDKYFRLAKKEGYAARSAYKLLEIQERRHTIRPRHWVLDIGCAPGSWLQVVSKICGSRGRVVGIDLSPVTVPDLENVRTIVGDAFKADPMDLLRAVNDSPGPTEVDDAGRDVRTADQFRRFDMVMSDMAPATTGTPTADHFRSVDCCRRVLAISETVLEPGGNLIMKVFEGESYPELVKDCQKLFRDAKGLRPDAVREVSREIYILGFGYLAVSKK